MGVAAWLLVAVYGGVVFPAWGAEFDLFERHGLQRLDYGAMVSQIRPGDTLIFSDGARYTVQGFLGTGNSTLVFDLGGAKALRIPKKWGETRHITYFTRGYKALAEQQVPMPKLFEHREMEYAVVEKLPVRFTLEDLLSDRANVSSGERQRALAALPEMARRVARFNYIADFHQGQLVWTGQTWMLLDWSNMALPWTGQNSGHPFHSIFSAHTHPELREKMDYAVCLERGGNPLTCGCRYLFGRLGRLWPKGR